MYRIVDEAGNTYSLYTYSLESEFEKMIVANVNSIFGKDGIYFDIKKLKKKYQAEKK